MVWRPSPGCCLLLVLLFAPAQPLLTTPFPHLPLYPQQLRSHPQLCAPASASGAPVGGRRKRNGGKKPGSRPGKPPSFVTRLQQAKTAEDGLELLSGAPDASGTVAALQRLALLCPRSSADVEAAWALRHDARLADAIAALAALTGASQLGVTPRCAALWSLGMCWDPTTPHSSASRLRTAAAALAAPLEVSSLGDGWNPGLPPKLQLQLEPHLEPQPNLNPTPSPGVRRSDARHRAASGIGGGVGVRGPRTVHAAIARGGSARRALPAACARRRRRARRGRGRPRGAREWQRAGCSGRRLRRQEAALRQEGAFPLKAGARRRSERRWRHRRHWRHWRHWRRWRRGGGGGGAGRGGGAGGGDGAGGRAAAEAR